MSCCDKLHSTQISLVLTQFTFLFCQSHIVLRNVCESWHRWWQRESVSSHSNVNSCHTCSGIAKQMSCIVKSVHVPLCSQCRFSHCCLDFSFGKIIFRSWLLAVGYLYGIFPSIVPKPVIWHFDTVFHSAYNVETLLVFSVSIPATELFLAASLLLRPVQFLHSAFCGIIRCHAQCEHSNTFHVFD